MFDELYPEEMERELGTRELASPKVEPGFAERNQKLLGAGKTTMRELARAGSAIDLLGAAVPVTIDWMRGGTELQDQYFAEHEEVFGKALDYWTPRPEERSLAGDVTGSLIGMGAQFVLGAPVLLNTALTGTAEDMVRQGVDSKTALGVGGIQAAFTAAGIRLPAAFGTKLGTKLATGAGGNVALGTTSRFLSQETLEAGGYAEQAQGFDPLAADAVLVELGMGALFGGAAHMQARPRTGRVDDAQPSTSRAAETVRYWLDGVKPSDKDAVLALADAVSVEKRSPGIPVRPKDLDSHVQALETAIRQATAGDAVDVAASVVARGMTMRPDPELPANRMEAAQSAALVTDALPGLDEILVPRVAGSRIADRLQEPGTRDALEQMSKEAGWAEVGGRLLRKSADPASPDYAEIAGRTQWIPKADWWPGRPDKLNEAKVREAVRKALAGEKLGKAEARSIEYMLDVIDAEGRINPDLASVNEINRLIGDAAGQSLESGMDDFGRLTDAEIINDAMTRLGEAEIERAALANEGDQGGFVRDLMDRMNAQPQVKAALQVLKDNPDLRIADGVDAAGNPIHKTAAEALREADAEIEMARRDSRLFEVAANCLTR